MSSAVVEPGRVIAGRYRVEGLLGQGAMGSVHRAVQLSVGRAVALKLLVDEHRSSTAYIERFEREAEALSRLSHPNTVRLFDFGTTEQGCPFLVMELLVGSDLASDLERQGPLRWDQMLAVVQGVAASLAEAHAAGIVHRDIKPANVFLCAGGVWPAIKVLDFGVAGATHPVPSRKLTMTGTVIGSAAYMSPEQAQGQPSGAASDLYGLGVLAFEALTGRTPFEPRAFTAQLLAKVLEPAPALRQVWPGLDVPAEVERLVGELLEREPARRPASASAVLERATALLKRASLPPLARSVLTAAEGGARIAKTVPMRVERTIDEGWSPPKTEVDGVPRAAQPRRALRRVFWASLAAMAGIASGWALAARAPHVVPLVVASLAPPAPGLEAAAPPELAPTSVPVASEPAPAPAASSLPPGSPEPLGAPAASEDTETAAALPKEKPPKGPPTLDGNESSVSSSVAQSETAVAERQPQPARPPSPRARPRPRPAAPPESPGPSATAASPANALPAPSSDGGGSSSTQRGPNPARPSSAAASTVNQRSRDLLRRFPDMASVRQALAAGVITPLQRNRLIARLSERRYEARARAARDYQAGRISRSELRARQHAIEREFEGFPSAP
jgi:eukaryotic-like serine/threonine-protein kinase